MASNVRIEWEDNFLEKAFHYRSSLNPLGDQVRQVTDEIGNRAKSLALAEAARWEAQRDSTKGLLKGKTYKTEKMRYFRAKAMAYALKRYADTLRFTMEKDGKENYGQVGAYFATGDRVEFGGADPKIDLGKSEERLEYPAFAFLRRAVNGG